MRVSEYGAFFLLGRAHGVAGEEDLLFSSVVKDEVDFRGVISVGGFIHPEVPIFRATRAIVQGFVSFGVRVSAVVSHPDVVSGVGQHVGQAVSRRAENEDGGRAGQAVREEDGQFVLGQKMVDFAPPIRLITGFDGCPSLPALILCMVRKYPSSVVTRCSSAG